MTLRLPAPLHVSPARGRARPPSLRPDDGSGDVLDRPRSDVGLPRGARPYVPGDSRRLVHWRSTAHAGKVMVRELEQPAARAVTITVDLPAEPDAAERVAEDALGTVVGLLEGGAPVLLEHPRAGGPGRGRGGRPAERRPPVGPGGPAPRP